MDMVIEKQYTVSQLRNMLRQAKTVEEIRRIKELFPKLSDEERTEGHRRLDDGVYNSEGILVGERHEDD